MSDGKVRQIKSIKGYTGTTSDGEPLIQRCDQASPLMAISFPELKVIYGEYQIANSNDWVYHVWCVTPEGKIVDPTGRQFDRESPDSYKSGLYRTAEEAND